MKKNWLTTAGGIMALFGAIPIALGTAGVHMPSWPYIICISFGVIWTGHWWVLPLRMPRLRLHLRLRSRTRRVPPQPSTK
jgi:hypothetical protein